jgi:hypothetical protein
MKYTKEGPIKTLKDDDDEFMVDKFWDRGDDVVRTI